MRTLATDDEPSREVGTGPDFRQGRVILVPWGELAVEPPPVQGYLNCGAKRLGAPAWDPAFNPADLPPGRRRRFLG